MPEWLSAIESKAVIELFGGFIGGLLVAWFARYRARKQWESRLALHRLNVSVNVFSDGWLKIRTIFETPIEHVIPNVHARELVTAAAKRATADDPIVVLPPAHHGFVLNYILNATAERFGAGAILADIGRPVASATYALFLTCEPVTEERQRKIRAMLLRRDLIENFPYEAGMPKLERPHHADRVVTLRVAAAKFKENPELFPLVEISA